MGSATKGSTFRSSNNKDHFFRSLIQHPLTLGMDSDDPQTTIARQRIVREKAFLRRLYRDWYSEITAQLPAGHGTVLEIGSGPGFLSEHIPGLLTSEVLHVPNVGLVLDAQKLPFRRASLRAVVMTDVLHHIPRPTEFLRSAGACVQPGGRIVMVEPWRTAWSEFVYRRFHSEPFVSSAGWELPPGGPLSGANGAIPWILFERDRSRLLSELPEWRIVAIRRMMPFRYLVSGGVSMRSFMPGCTYELWRKFDEVLLHSVHAALAMFALVVLERTSAESAWISGGATPALRRM